MSSNTKYHSFTDTKSSSVYLINTLMNRPRLYLYSLHPHNNRALFPKRLLYEQGLIWSGAVTNVVNTGPMQLLRVQVWCGPMQLWSFGIIWKSATCHTVPCITTAHSKAHKVNSSHGDQNAQSTCHRKISVTSWLCYHLRVDWIPWSGVGKYYVGPVCPVVNTVSGTFNLGLGLGLEPLMLPDARHCIYERLTALT